jgi:hypothetical protein
LAVPCNNEVEDKRTMAYGRGSTATELSRAATVAALGVCALLIAADLLEVAFGFLSVAAYGAGQTPGAFADYAEALGAQLASGVFLSALPLAVAVFIVFRFVAPIGPDLGPRAVIVRSVMATIVASVVILVVGFVLSLARMNPISVDGALFAGSFPAFSFVAGNVVPIFINAVGSAVLTFVDIVPVVVLAGMLQWIWRRRSSATRTTASDSAPTRNRGDAPGSV